jgi:hypothetical protein
MTAQDAALRCARTIGPADVYPNDALNGQLEPNEAWASNQACFNERRASMTLLHNIKYGLTEPQRTLRRPPLWKRAARTLRREFMALCHDHPLFWISCAALGGGAMIAYAEIAMWGAP